MKTTTTITKTLRAQADNTNTEFIVVKCLDGHIESVEVTKRGCSNTGGFTILRFLHDNPMARETLMESLCRNLPKTETQIEEG